MGWEFFDAYADEYDRWFEEHSAEFLAELARVREFLPVAGTEVVEIGAGSGRFTVALGARLGIEPSPALARMARKRGAEIVRGRAECLPLRTRSVPAALCITVICYLDNPLLAFRECFRVLEPEGVFIVAFIERGGLVHQKYLHAPGKHRFLSRARFYARREVVGILCSAGFLVERIDPRAGFCLIAARKKEGLAGGV
ncbi:MAG: class I SAM-dependent methyltransferase [Methanolinea sp.]|jgi:ubiquinone/menaquinone biosynthesis C-methylase UbiE|nr:class I SAM-dependent methyltransferase [Methanolinea sp.]